MRVKKRPFHFFLLAVLLGGLSLYAIISYPPTFSLPLNSYRIPLFPFVVTGVLVTIFFFTSYLFRTMLQGFLVTLFVISYLSLRYFGLKHIFFLLMLLAIFISLEVFFFKKNN
ncbi:MAG TPA: hypothetical protein VGT05_03130 [Patescibacteria group bacterium]|nr:hypothetical protein [Patescibacteria group bacterium]